MFKFKGQSAIEYLMTYGWMLLVVAVVGATVFSVTQGRSVSSVSGFTGSDVGLDALERLRLETCRLKCETLLLKRLELTV